MLINIFIIRYLELTQLFKNLASIGNNLQGLMRGSFGFAIGKPYGSF